MKIRYLALIFVTLAALVSGMFGQRAFAAEPVSLKNVVLSVYPEYDDPMGLGSPSVLVMVDGEIVGATAPATVRFLVPSNAVMYSAGSGPRDKYVGGPPDRKASDIPGWDEISYELKTNIFVVEYYAPISSEANRRISYDFRTLYLISNLRVLVQEPRKSSNYTVSPSGPTSTDSDGLKVHSYSYASVTPDKPLHFDIAYTKTAPKPSLGSSTGSMSGSTFAIIIGSLTAAALFVWFLSTKRRSRYSVQSVRGGSKNGQTRAARRRELRKTGSARSEGSPKSGGSPKKFCSQCGQPIESSAQFCPSCGIKVEKAGQ
ncbi:MAG: zinc ribbon domain-containing protein [Chloroflexi bacterium]|nr:zinc ribbon domain-containing protein [Chloroflexota bacterium]